MYQIHEISGWQSAVKMTPDFQKGVIFMFKKILSFGIAAIMTVALAACGASSAPETAQTETVSEETTAEATTETVQADTTVEETTEEETTEEETATEAAPAIGTVPNTLAEDEAALVAAYADAFTQYTYEDEETGLSIEYNLYLPEGYDASGSYPMVVFIADASCVGKPATASLTQGRGALVWASDEWQAVHPTIIAVPKYDVTVLDDHSGYTTTEYVELTKRFIDSLSSEYAVDTERIYGTGQSMGCMIALILASEYPDLYAGCMFVDGQWDATTLAGLEDQTFVYFAAEDDTKAWTGSQEVMAMFDTDSEPYGYAQWDGSWSVDELSAAAQELFNDDEQQYFISWTTGTIQTSGGGMGGGSYHMASFDYAYNCVAVMEWLFQQ